MRYRLVVLTHGRAETLGRAVGSFQAMVTPAPVDAVLVLDGPNQLGSFASWKLAVTEEQEGFCKATARAWRIGAQPGVDHVLYLEHDFLFTRPLDLRQLASVLKANPQLAQMQLMRDAVNAEEKNAGGLYESRPGQYERRYHFDKAGVVPGRIPDEDGFYDRFTWLEHHSYLTTNVSLMRREFMRTNPWLDDGLPECEGRFGIELVKRGYSFGVWGNGEPWTKHIGVRDGFGY